MPDSSVLSATAFSAPASVPSSGEVSPVIDGVVDGAPSALALEPDSGKVSPVINGMVDGASGVTWRENDRRDKRSSSALPRVAKEPIGPTPAP